MVVSDRVQALHYLSHINYYRLAGYLLPFEADHTTHQLKLGTRFEDALALAQVGIASVDREQSPFLEVEDPLGKS